jgi:hypothetical protein
MRCFIILSVFSLYAIQLLGQREPLPVAIEELPSLEQYQKVIYEEAGCKNATDHKYENRTIYRPMVVRIYDDPEYIMVEQEPDSVNTNVYPPVHGNSPGLNRRIHTYSDIYHSPYR